MSHEILGQRFIERDYDGRPAWHKLGTIFDRTRELSASDAVAEVARDIIVRPYPLFYLDPETQEHVALDGHQAVMREPLPDAPARECFGVTSDRWHQVDYAELAKALDELSKTYKVETAGALFDGSLVFVSLRGPDFAVKGDSVQDYFIANLSQQPGKAHTVKAAPVRVVCNNTNLLAERDASINLAVEHSQHARAKIKLAGDMVARFKELTSRTQAAFTAMAEARCTTEALFEILAKAWPDPPKPAELRMVEKVTDSREEGALKDALGAHWERVVDAQERYDRASARQAALREAGQESFERFNPAELRGTVWAAYNAVTEVADWREGRNADSGSLFGGRANEKVRGYRASMEAVKALS